MSNTSEAHLTPITKLLANLSIIKSQSPSKTPTVLITTGSMNPVHKQHYNNFEMAKIVLESKLPDIKVIAGYLSPSQDVYVSGKLGRYAIPIDERIEMCKLAVSESDWVDVCLWESKSVRSNQGFIDCWQVAERLSKFLNENDEINCKIKVFYLCGSDHYNKFRMTRNLLRGNGLVVVCREKDDNWIENAGKALDPNFGTDAWKDTIMFVKGKDNLDISSTTIRDKFVYGLSEWEDLCDPKVAKYIKENKILTK